MRGAWTSRSRLRFVLSHCFLDPSAIPRLLEVLILVKFVRNNFQLACIVPHVCLSFRSGFAEVVEKISGVRSNVGMDVVPWIVNGNCDMRLQSGHSTGLGDIQWNSLDPWWL